ncbi:hypothetical protein [Halomontanus rarus]|uniref:hypothetical protein n=1 Tax=Halomontanus rarus TaxID=3034020 RepID=UPI001A99B9D3
MPDEEYYAVINDNPAFGGEAVTFCRDGNDNHVHRDKKTALNARDELREEYDNPAINVYRMTLHSDPVEHNENRCVHCGGTDTFIRSDGDLACDDCPGITVTSCEVCGQENCVCPIPEAEGGA